MRGAPGAGGPPLMMVWENSSNRHCWEGEGNESVRDFFKMEANGEKFEKNTYNGLGGPAIPGAPPPPRDMLPMPC